MSKFERIGNVLAGILTLVIAVFMFLAPKGALPVVAGILSFTFTVKGIYELIYYISLARFMVGGKATLYTGIIWIDAGIMTGIISDSANAYIILYLAAVHLFSGLLDVLRAREARGTGSPTWRRSAATGGANIALALMVIIGGLIMHSETVAVYVYAAGLAYSSIVRIITSFRKTAMVYIQ